MRPATETGTMAHKVNAALEQAPKMPVGNRSGYPAWIGSYDRNRREAEFCSYERA
jgi:hypothetical protein